MSLGLADELPRALEQGEIVPYYQPLVDLQTTRTIGFEVLARWVHPERQIIPPLEFIPLAEQTGLIGKLSEHILRRRRWSGSRRGLVRACRGHQPHARHHC